jgi:hypothetical protein
MPLGTRPAADTLGDKFFTELTQKDPARVQSNERVDPERLDTLAGNLLIKVSVESYGEQNLSTEKKRAILTFPLNYVPITDRDRLSVIIDRRQLAEKIAFSAVRPLGKSWRNQRLPLDSPADHSFCEPAQIQT